MTTTVSRLPGGIEVEVDDATGEIVDDQLVTPKKLYGGLGQPVPRKTKRHLDFESMTEAEKAAEYEIAKNSEQPVSLGVLLNCNEKVAEIFRDVAKTIKAMRAEIAELKARPTMKYCGVFQQGKSYTVGDCVTRSGSIWHCDHDTDQAPGNGNRSWTLAVKSGR